jgi:hypothetical protein
MYSQKRISPASLLISTKYFYNRIIMSVCNYGIHKIVQYKMQPFSCQHREKHISKQNYEISVEQGIHISRLELQR